MEVEKFIVTEDQIGRIDQVIPKFNPDWSRTQVQTWIKDGHVTVNNKKTKVNYKCKTSDIISIAIPNPTSPFILPEQLNLDIFYEDKDIIVVNKPKGMVVHPSFGHTTGTLVNGLLFHCKDLSGINGVMRPGIVHRIDKDTSGLLMIAKNDMSHNSLANQLIEKSTVRKYVAFVHGVIPHDKGTIDAPIGRNKNDRKKMTVTDVNSKEAVTHFRVLERFSNYTLVECQLETGRTHQIRVHMKYIGFPLVGDNQYGPKKTLKINGQALHAKILGFIHPRTKEYLEFESPLPSYFEKLLKNLKKSN